MAPKPPKPGNTPNSPAVKAKEERRRKVAVITLAGETYRLHLSDIGVQDDLICRKHTGFPFQEFRDNWSPTSILVFVWMARRKAGENNLPFAKVAADYLTDEAVHEAVTYGDIVDEDDLIDVEGVIDVKEADGDDPLPSGEA